MNEAGQAITDINIANLLMSTPTPQILNIY